jgi:hypothetical protein
VAIVLLSSVLASLIWPKDAELNIEVDLPENFDAPFEDTEDALREADSVRPGDEPKGTIKQG